MGVVAQNSPEKNQQEQKKPVDLVFWDFVAGHLHTGVDFAESTHPRGRVLLK
jgi:hypothetical protein